MLHGRFTIAIVLLASLLVVSAQNRNCGQNEKYTTCGTACPETCTSPPNRVCTQQCIIGCECRSGFVRGRNGKCIPRSRC
ncbi:chymotrypsin inhibitor-like [Teleopsis dalmanni]|uniref:chymotrypsin inhibitor-like n=1 Tax=Teleopsis dalmanni TaxID=139649 RepID=UPI0018CEA19A|nr:chymotrypsin inhibitor-like [Teleopsis dalmanni]